MAYQFERESTASFKFQDTNAKSITLQGINAEETDASVITDGITELLKINGMTGYFEGAIRTVKEDVYDDE